MSLKQLKLDYINFITQSYNSIGFDPNKIGVLFSLILEQDYLTQDQIMSLTGFSRSTVSSALSDLMSLTSQFPVLQTKKPGDSRKYYKCPLNFEQYSRIFFTASFEISDFNMDFLGDLLNKLEAFEPSNPSVEHVKKYFRYLMRAQEFYKTFIEHSKSKLEEYFNTKELDSEVFIKKHKNRIKSFKETKFNSVAYSETKFDEIKREFLTTMQNISGYYTGRKELIGVFLSLYLEYDPVTQDCIMELTGYSRSTVSESLSILSKLNRIQVIKKPKDRKKYYKPFVKIEDYGFLKFQNVKHFFTQLITIMNIKFIPELEKLSINKQLKIKYKNFFESNIYHFEHLLKYTEIMHEIIFKQFLKVIKKA